MINYDETSIMVELRSMYECAKRRTLEFYPEKYHCTLGAHVLNNLDVICNLTKHKDEPTTLFGIAVESDYANPYNIQLWENITGDV